MQKHLYYDEIMININEEDGYTALKWNVMEFEPLIWLNLGKMFELYISSFIPSQTI